MTRVHGGTCSRSGHSVDRQTQMRSRPFRVPKSRISVHPHSFSNLAQLFRPPLTLGPPSRPSSSAVFVRKHRGREQGRYVRVSGDASGGGAGAWFGVHFGLWKTHGTSPLWLIFDDGKFGRGQEVRPLIEPWATQNGFLTATSDHDIAIALEIPEGEEKDEVIRSLAADLKAIAVLLERLPPKTGQEPAQEEGDETAL